MANELSNEQWNKLLSVLSLTCAVPFYHWMRVPVEDVQRFQTVLREVIREGRRQYQAKPENLPDLFALLVEKMGRAAFSKFETWAQNVFLGYHADQPDWSAWDIVFSQWAYSRSEALSFLPVEKRAAFVRNYRQEATTGDVRDKAREVLKNPLTDWDIEMYARRDWGASWESGPFTILESIVRIERLKQFAKLLQASLDEREREALQSQAEMLIKELGVWMPGPLPSLDVLVRTL